MTTVCDKIDRRLPTRPVAAAVALVCAVAAQHLAAADRTKVATGLTGVVVSDTNRFTCGSGTVACVSPDGNRLLVPYLASTTGFGECHDLTAVADVPLDAPGTTRSHVACRAGETFLGETVKSVLSYASFVWKGGDADFP